MRDFYIYLYTAGSVIELLATTASYLLSFKLSVGLDHCFSWLLCSEHCSV